MKIVFRWLFQFSMPAIWPPPKLAFLGVVHGRERDLCFHFCFHAPPLPRLLLVHFWKGPPGGQALLQFWKHLQNLNSFSAAVKKRQGSHAVSHSYWPVNGTLTCRSEIKFFFCVTLCRTWRQLAGIWEAIGARSSRRPWIRAPVHVARAVPSAYHVLSMECKPKQLSLHRSQCVWFLCVQRNYIKINVVKAHQS